MNIDTRERVSTFGGVDQFSDNRPMTLRSRSDIPVPGRYIHPITPARVKNGSKRVADVCVRLLLADLNVGLDHYCGGKVGRGSNMQACVALASTCLISSHAAKAEIFKVKRLFIMTPAKSGRVTIYLDPSVAVESITGAMVNFLLALEFPVKFWSSFLPRVLSCSIVEVQELIASLDSSSKKRSEFIIPKKKLKVDVGIANLAFIFFVNVFKISDSSQATFESMWPQLRDRIVTLSHVVVLLGSSFSASVKTTSCDASSVMVALGLLQDVLGSDDDLTDVPLRSCWQGMCFVNQTLTDLFSVTLPL